MIFIQYICNMALFGSDWLDDHDSMKEYETHVGGMSFAEEYMHVKYDKPIGAPIHLEDGYDSLKEYEQKLN